MARIDHLVIAALDLEQGAAYLEAKLGVRPGPGGKHATMGTHNLLMRLGGDVYLEVIAADPDAPAPDHARWFNLDDPDLRRSMASQPRLLTWVVGVDDIDEGVRTCSYDAGQPQEMSRGDLQWRIALRATGRLAMGGLAPILIQWPAGPHPSHNMPDPGCRLDGLTLNFADPAKLVAGLTSIGAQDLVEIGQADQGEERLVATIKTPRGSMVLS